MPAPQQIPAIVFKPAVRFAVKLKAAFDGPTGSGKTEGALEIATALCREYGGRFAVADTEALGEQAGAASLYADRYSFDTILVPGADPATLEAVIDAAVAQKYTALVIDTMSHAWKAVTDAKEQHELNDSRANKWTLWGIYGPKWDRLLAKVIRSDIHLLVTMRSKMAHEQVEQGGVKKIVKLGMQAQVREGAEYEFSIVFSVNMQHRAIVSKGRAVPWDVDRELLDLRDRNVQRQLIDWMNTGGTATAAQAPAIAPSPESLNRAAEASSHAPSSRAARPDDVLLEVDAAELTLAQAMTLPLFGAADKWQGHGSKPLRDVPKGVLEWALKFFREKLEDPATVNGNRKKMEAMAAAIPLVLIELDRDPNQTDAFAQAAGSGSDDDGMPSDQGGAPAAATPSSTGDSAAGSSSSPATTPSSPSSTPGAPSAGSSSAAAGSSSAAPSSNGDKSAWPNGVSPTAPSGGASSSSAGSDSKPGKPAPMSSLLEQLKLIVENDAMQIPAMTHFRKEIAADKVKNPTAAKRAIALATMALQISERLEKIRADHADDYNLIVDQMESPLFYTAERMTQAVEYLRNTYPHSNPRE
jgi:hypothetical protein